VSISTHVLDLVRGRPAADVGVVLERFQNARWIEIATGRTDDNGRAADLVPRGTPLAGTFRLTFETGAYFRAHATQAFYPFPLRPGGLRHRGRDPALPRAAPPRTVRILDLPGVLMAADRDYLEKNRAAWNRRADEYQATHRSQLGVIEPTWGVWAVPESELQVLGDVRSKDVLELGCGGAQWSVALARRGARMTGLDLSDQQLVHARRNVEQAVAGGGGGVQVRLVQGNAEATPFADASFDIVFCDHGGFTFTDPRRTVPEAARLLRKGGLLAFNITSAFLDVCWDPAKRAPGERMVTPYFGMHHFEDPDGDSFNVPYGEWIRLFRASGLVVEDLIEIRRPPGGTTTYEGYVDPAWAERWPSENIWKCTRRGQA
jgi:SAM-dependent methyltransferase